MSLSLKINVENIHNDPCQKSYNFVDPFNGCYKQKCKVASFNLGHPVEWTRNCTPQPAIAARWKYHWTERRWPCNKDWLASDEQACNKMCCLISSWVVIVSPSPDVTITQHYSTLFIVIFCLGGETFGYVWNCKSVSNYFRLLLLLTFTLSVKLFILILKIYMFTV